MLPSVKITKSTLTETTTNFGSTDVRLPPPPRAAGSGGALFTPLSVHLSGMFGRMNHKQHQYNKR